MYKKQMNLQKIVCLLAMVASVLVFIYSLGIMTDLYDCLYSTMRNPADLTQTSVSGSIVYYDMQGFNSQYLNASIVLILTACLLFLTNTNIRRKYYIGNYFAVAVYVIANLGVAFWSHAQIEMYKAEFLMLDFEALLKHSEMWKTAYTESTFWFDLHYGVMALTVIACVALVANVVWKMNLMKAEKALITKGKEVAV